MINNFVTKRIGDKEDKGSQCVARVSRVVARGVDTEDKGDKGDKGDK